MKIEAELLAILDFIKSIEKLKDTLRSAYTSSGKQESTAEHTWRLCILVMLFHQKFFPEMNFERMVKIALVHDLGEALNGDIPAPEQGSSKSDAEREDLIAILQPLPEEIKMEFLSLWEEYDNASSEEARLIKALDKMETLIQHNQGKNPEDFDYAFNLDYGRKHTDKISIVSQLRKIIDAETLAHSKK